MIPILRIRQIGMALGLVSAFLPNAVIGADAAGTPAPVVPAASPIAHWSDIKGDTYAQRAHFANGAKLLVARLDSEIAPPNAKRAAMVTDTKDWDFDMKEVNNCRGLLVDRIAELPQATTPEAWGHVKDEVGLAWHRAILAVDKMASTVTS